MKWIQKKDQLIELKHLLPKDSTEQSRICRKTKKWEVKVFNTIYPLKQIYKQMQYERKDQL